MSEDVFTQQAAKAIHTKDSGKVSRRSRQGKVHAYLVAASVLDCLIHSGFA